MNARSRAARWYLGRADSLNVSLERLHVDGLGPPVAGLGIKGHLGALSQRLETFAADAAVVDEEVFSALVRGDEAEALVVVEPLDGSGWHARPPSHVLRTRRLLEATTARWHCFAGPHGRKLLSADRTRLAAPEPVRSAGRRDLAA